MHRRSLLTGLTALPAGAFGARPARASAAMPIVVELFTSQSCSSCPPADALLGQLAERPDILALSFHVTYWNRLGWHDRFSLEAATARQRRYAATLGHGQIYTPQMVVQGRQDVVGSDRRAVTAVLAAARPGPVAVAQETQAGEVLATAGPGVGHGQVWLVGFDARQVTAIGGGENGGRRLTYHHVVRSLTAMGEWDGASQRYRAPRPEGERVAILLQARGGEMLGAAMG